MGGVDRLPTLFDLGPRLLTTREVAEAVKLGGTAALTTAERRADAATYQEVRCRSALNRVEGMPFRWTLNPYRGCTHACQYCFARRYQSQLELDAGDEFSSLIVVKTNFVEVLKRELDAPRWMRELAALGTATDPYQPIEGHYRLSRGTLAALADGRTPVGLVTKGPLVVRDIDVLQTLTRCAGATIYLSVPTVDERAWRSLEPGTAPPAQRLRAVKALVDAGLEAGVLMAPLVPGFSTAPRAIEETVRAIADAGARFVGANVLFLDGATRDHFLRFLEREFPSLSAHYDRLYASKHVPRDYADRVRRTVGMLKARYGLVERARGGEARRETVTASPPGAAQPGAAQPAFNWSR
jgi:DNA repair photolyase